MDAISLYPSLEVEKSAEIIKQEVIGSNVVFDNIDKHELGIYLRTNLSQEYITNNGYDEVLPSKITERFEENEVSHENSVDLFEYADAIQNLFNGEETDMDIDKIEVEFDAESPHNADQQNGLEESAAVDIDVNSITDSVIKNSVQHEEIKYNDDNDEEKDEDEYEGATEASIDACSRRTFRKKTPEIMGTVHDAPGITDEDGIRNKQCKNVDKKV